ncbi:MAG: hypothetical protein CL943_03250 [Candidatus Diapherotrites archaeon]|uniref:Uncharacterized protein n=1 Tax=Candidatus Iainarchaeum sp. TaxID=3101447 RepID=A0A2D6M1J3_9ARCH|nr:hypothetical protein [Candidatus Diapherotrites archaeon]|tara:strand:+ start:3343 stop:3603 length:261 start_codon:yes stop_codon:yes gene_type:complete
MSYIRPGHENRFVAGTSKDYVFPALNGKGEEYIEDYGKLSKKGLCEILCGVISIHYTRQAEKEYFMRQLADKLNVRLRKGQNVRFT